MQDIMTPEQVARYLHLSTDTIYRLIRGRRLAATCIGRSYRVSRRDLEAFLAANSMRSEVRQRMFKRVATIREHNPGVDDDSLMADLEQVDATRPSTITYPT